MGCGFSRFDGHGVAFPAKLRPLYFLQEMKVHKSKQPVKNSISTPSKKLLLLHAEKQQLDYDDDKYSFASCTSPWRISHDHIEESLRGEEQNGQKESKIDAINEDLKAAEIEDEFVDASNPEDDDDERMIGHDCGFIGSPSFRVYCEENRKDDDQFHDAGDDHEDIPESTVSSVDTISSEMKSVDEEKVRKKRGKCFPKNSLRKVLPKVLSGRSSSRSSN